MSKKRVTISKTITEEDGTEVLYSYSVITTDSNFDVNPLRLYASMVEYGLTAMKWKPRELSFPKEYLYQFIQRQTLNNLESANEDIIYTAHENALSYVSSYVGSKFDINAILEKEETDLTSNTLRLALLISTVVYILAVVPQYSDVMELHRRELHLLLKGLKSAQRSFGKDSVIQEPDVRVSSVKLNRTGARI